MASKLLPDIVTVAPGAAICGEIDVIDGAGPLILMVTGVAVAWQPAAVDEV